MNLADYYAESPGRADGVLQPVTVVHLDQAGATEVVAWNSATGELVATAAGDDIEVLAVFPDLDLAHLVAGSARTAFELDTAIRHWQREGPAGFHLDATPFLRPPNRWGGWAATPPGWETRAVGVFEGPPREIVFDPARHDILVAPPGTFAGREEQLENSGWWPVGQWSGGEVWGRDRTGATRAALSCTGQTRAADIETRAVS
ncbi:MAG: hypothetical protein ACRD0U_19885 [Acidimicrobiales bacterium]